MKELEWVKLSLITHRWTRNLRKPTYELTVLYSVTYCIFSLLLEKIITIFIIGKDILL
jgi:hypothetical protein